MRACNRIIRGWRWTGGNHNLLHKAVLEKELASQKLAYRLAFHHVNAFIHLPICIGAKQKKKGENNWEMHDVMRERGYDD